MKDKKKTKRYGTLNSAVSNVMSKDTPVKAPDTSKIDVGSTPKLKAEPTSFAEAFRAARKEKGSGSTFSWKGKSYSTNMASDKSTPTARRASSTAPKPSTPDSSKAKIPAMLKASDKGAAATSSKPSAPKPTTGLSTSAYESALKSGTIPGNVTEEEKKQLRSTMSMTRATKLGPTVDKPRSAVDAETARFRRRNANPWASQGMAKGGSIDGCAIRGKTKAR